MILPKAFEEEMQSLLKEDYEDYLKSYKKPLKQGLRINTLKLSPEAYLKLTNQELKPVPWNPNGLYYNGSKTYSKNPLYHAGLYYIQEPSAMLPAHLLPVTPGDKVLDMCAAPGGKSTALGAKLCGEGLLVSNDISNSRAKALQKNIELAGIVNSMVLSEYPEKLTEYFPEYFDKILIDAPCSGEGMFHKKPIMVENWENTGPEFYGKIQREIVLYGARMLKPGGCMVYSTCTFSPHENEGTIKYLLENCPDIHVVDTGMIGKIDDVNEIDSGKPQWVDGPEELQYCMRLWPHKTAGEGHFVTLLKKDEGPKTGNTPKLQLKQVKELEIFRSFLKTEKLPDIYEDNRFMLQGDHLYYLPEDVPEIKGLRILRLGLYLGNIKKNRFEPSGTFSRALDPAQCEKVIDFPYDGQEVVRYLKCETLEVDEKLPSGWYLVCSEGYPLGFAKIANGTLKNKYPAGWRWV